MTKFICGCGEFEIQENAVNVVFRDGDNCAVLPKLHRPCEEDGLYCVKKITLVSEEGSHVVRPSKGDKISGCHKIVLGCEQRSVTLIQDGHTWVIV
jgi:hypothetical protein